MRTLLSPTPRRPNNPAPNLPRLLALGGALPVPLGVDAGGEGVLVGEGDLVDEEDPGGEEQAGGLGVEEGGADEAAGGAVVHGGVGDVEGEAGDDAVHEDAEVVAEEGAGDAEGPGRRDDQHVAARQQAVRQPAHLRPVLQQPVRRLRPQRPLVQEVAHQPQREDGRRQRVARRLRPPAEEPGQDLVVVFC